MSNDLREVLAHLRSDPGGGVRRNRVPPRGNLHPHQPLHPKMMNHPGRREDCQDS